MYWGHGCKGMFSSTPKTDAIFNISNENIFSKIQCIRLGVGCDSHTQQSSRIGPDNTI